MADPTGPRATFWQRLGAYLVDVIAIGVVAGIVGAFAGFAVYRWLGLVLGLAYFTFFEGSRSGQTPGKRLVGIRVYDFRQGGPIGYGRGLVRTIGRYISAIACLLGYLWVIWDREKQAWHDKIATTVVVPAESYPVESWPGF